MDTAEPRVCTHCLIPKPLGDFRVRSKNKALRQSWCKKCQRLASNRSRKKWPMRYDNLRTHLNSLRRKEGFNVTIGELRGLGCAAGQTCYLCGVMIESHGDAELDHVMPLSRGGLSEIGNLRWTHRTCNRIKHDLPLDELVTHLRLMLAHIEDSRNTGSVSISG